MRTVQAGVLVLLVQQTLSYWRAPYRRRRIQVRRSTTTRSATHAARHVCASTEPRPPRRRSARFPPLPPSRRYGPRSRATFERFLNLAAGRAGAQEGKGEEHREASPRRDCSWKLSRGCAVINSGAWFIQLDFWNVLTAISRRTDREHSGRHTLLCPYLG